MGKYEILEFLKEEREKDPNKWLSVKEIKDGLQARGVSPNTIQQARYNLFRLATFDLIKWKPEGAFKLKHTFQAYKF